MFFVLALGQYLNVLSLILEERYFDLEMRRKHLNTLKVLNISFDVTSCNCTAICFNSEITDIIWALFQMLCYLLAQFMDGFEAEATNPSTQVAPGRVCINYYETHFTISTVYDFNFFCIHCTCDS